MQDLLQNGNLTELEAGRQVLGDLSGALEAEVAARSQVIQLLKALLQQHVSLNTFPSHRQNFVNR